MGNASVRGNLCSTLLSLLWKVDEETVTGLQKLLLYRAGVCLCLIWDLTISANSPKSKRDYFLKKWVGLSRLENPASLYWPKDNGGMDLSSVVMLFKDSHGIWTSRYYKTIVLQCIYFSIVPC